MVKAGRATVDGKSLEQYGSPKAGFGTALQETLSMPMNTTPARGLPFKVTGSDSPKLYVEIYGTIVKKSFGSNITFQLLKGRDSFRAELYLVTMKADIRAKGTIPLKIDRERYFLSSRSLFEEYVKSGILTPKGELAAKAFGLACSAFFKTLKMCILMISASSRQLWQCGARRV